MLPVLLALVLTQVDSALAQFDAGRAAARTEDWPQAVECFERAAQLFPAWGLAQLELAEARLRAGADAAKTDEAFAAARQLEPNNPRAFAASGRWFESRGKVPEAVEAYRKALELRSDSLEWHERLGLLLGGAGRAAEAVPHLSAVLEGRPDDRGVRANLAEALEQAEDLRGAEAQLKRLVKDCPQNGVFRRRLALFYERTGQAEKAKAAWSHNAPPEKRPMRPLLPSRR